PGAAYVSAGQVVVTQGGRRTADDGTCGGGAAGVRSCVGAAAWRASGVGSCGGRAAGVGPGGVPGAAELRTATAGTTVSGSGRERLMPWTLRRRRFVHHSGVCPTAG